MSLRHMRDVDVRLVPWQRVLVFFAGMKVLDYAVDTLFEAMEKGGLRNWLDLAVILPFCFITGLLCWSIAIAGVPVPPFRNAREEVEG